MSDRHSDVSTTAASEQQQNGEAPISDRQAVWIRSAALSCILFLMTMYTLYIAASLIMPIALAFLLSLVFSPIVRQMVRWRIPQTLSALLVMIVVAGAMVAGVYALTEPASEWMDKAPSELRKLEYKLAWVKEPIKKIQETKEQVEEITEVSDDADEAQSPQQPTVSLVDVILNRTPHLMFGVVVMLVLLFFVLASGDAFLNKMVQVTPKLRDKKRVVETAREIQRHVSVYLGTISLINIGVGVVVAASMYLLNVPNPILWGVMVGVLNYVPYLGVSISIVVVGFVSLLTFDSPVQMLLPPAVIFAVNVIEGQFITPIVAGRRLSLSPVAVFLSIVVMGWIWGVVGVLIAVPVLATIKLVCEHVEVLEPAATFLGN